MKNNLKQFLLNIWFLKNKFKKSENIFNDIYKSHKWGKSNSGFSSGAGTRSTNVAIYIEEIQKFVKKNCITSIVEFGCGDFTVMSEILDNREINYTGYDISSVILSSNRGKYRRSNIEFIQSDCSNILFDPKRGDLLIIRQVLQHIDNESIKNILRHLDKYEFVIITEHLAKYPSKFNIDKVIGAHTRVHYNSGVFIDKPPFQIKAQEFLSYDENLRFAGNFLEAEIKSLLIVNNRNNLL